MKDNGQLSPWQAWSYEVMQKLKAHQELIEQLECTVNDLSAQLKKLEAKPTYNIESIQYHFDQLKVEKLEGKLNIGMSVPGLNPGGENGDNGDSSIEQLSVPQGDANAYPAAIPAMEPPDAAYRNVYSRLISFLNTEAHQALLQYEQELELPLDPYHRRIIIEDVRRQMPPRIHYYLQMHKKDNDEHASLYPDLMADEVYAKTRRDAEAAIGTYMRSLKAGNPGGGGLG